MNNEQPPNPLLTQIYYIDISTDKDTEILYWSSKNAPSFPVDVLAARSDEHADIFLHNETKTRRMVHIRKAPFTYVIGSENSVQFQLLEAILEEIIEEFMKNFGELPIDLLKSGMTKGFLDVIPDIIIRTKKERIKTIRTSCRVCNKNYAIIVKKSLVDKAPSYPVAVVFFHQGHGLLLYLDKSYQIRGAEIVDITG
jgi:hypothetical protein